MVGCLRSLYFGWEGACKACGPRALHKCSLAEAFRRIDVSLEIMKCLTVQASEASMHWSDPEECLKRMACSGLPYHGYGSKFARLLLQQLREGAAFAAVDKDNATPTTSLYASSHIASGARDGIRALTGDDMKDLKRSTTLCERRLRQIDAAIRDLWPAGVCRPETCPKDLCPQLCSWKRGNYAAESSDYPPIKVNLMLMRRSEH